MQILVLFMNYICKGDIVMLVVIKPKPPSTKYIPLLNLAGMTPIYLLLK